MHPLQEVAKIKATLQTCRRMLFDLQQSITAVLPEEAIQISHANQSLNAVAEKLDLREYELLRISVIQLQAVLDYTGNLPSLES